MISEDGIYMLIINDVTKHYDGDITCVASNRLGETNCHGKLTVRTKEVAPHWDKNITDQRVKQGADAVFEGTVTGVADPVVTWTMNGKPIDNNTDKVAIRQAGPDYFITISNVQPLEACEIVGKAVNPKGVSETKANLIVQAITPPKFIQPLKDGAAQNNAEVDFTVKVQSPDPVSVQWLINGKPVTEADGVKITSSGSDTFSLKLPAGYSPGDLKVECVAKNADGEADTKCSMKLEAADEKPAFLSRPGNDTCFVGETVEFEAEVTGKPEPSITWYIAGKQVTAADGETTFKNGKATLKIQNAQLSQTGEIKIKAENSVAVIESSGKLTVKEKTDAPRFVKGVNDQMMNEGDNVSWQVKAEGLPTPSLKWFLGGKELSTGGNIKIVDNKDGTGTLTIEGIKPDQMGLLECRAENSAGHVVSVANIAVTKKVTGAKPEFQSKLSPLNLTEGDVLRTKVLISGDPVPQAKWYINNTLVVKTEDTDIIAEDGVYILEIRGAAKEMTGTLKCVAYNKHGEVEQSTKINVTVPVPVEFETNLSDATCREGDTLKLKAVLLGEPTPDVTWYVNGKQLKESNKIKIQANKGTYTVVIKDITCDYSGIVECRAVNEYGEAHSKAKLLVLPRGEPPDFTEWMQNVSVKEGTQVVHRVVFTGDPKPEIRWWINDLEIRDSDPGITIKTVGNVCTLTIDSFNSTHVGEIICQAENEAGEVSCTAQQNFEDASVSAALAEDTMEVDDNATENGDDDTMIEDEPIMGPKFITKLSDVRVKKGQQAIFECVVPESKGIVVKWRKDGKEVQMLARILTQQIARDGNLVQQLIIKEAELGDAGQYECIVSNEAGEIMSTAKLTVLTADEAPSFKKGLTDVSVIEHAESKFTCLVGGNPMPDCEWVVGTVTIKSDTRHVIESKADGTQTLVIKDSLLTDAGEVKVIARNSVSKTESKAKLTVTAASKATAPGFSSKLTDQSVKEGETATFKCTVTGEPLPTSTWYLEGKEIIIDKTRITVEIRETTIIMTIRECTLKDKGVITCKLVNEAGTAECQGKLNVEQVKKEQQAQKDTAEAPKFVKTLSNTTIEEHDTTTLTCQVTGQPRPEVAWQRDGIDVTVNGTHIKTTYSEDGTASITIIDAAKTDIGEYSCKATNSAGQAATQAKLVIEELVAPKFKVELPTTEVVEGQKVDLECQLSPDAKPKPEIKWKKDDKEVKADGKHIMIEETKEGLCKLKIDIARSEDVGVYKCEAVNKAGKAETKTELKVNKAKPTEELIPPEFTVPLGEVKVEEGNPVDLTCTVKGSPPPEIQWVKDNKPVVADGKHIQISSTIEGVQKLKIDIAHSEDVGVYKCEAVNKAGKAETKGELKINEADVKEVQTPPEFTVPLGEVKVEEGNPVDLTCTVKGSPPPEIQWVKDNKPVVADGKHIQISSTIEGVQKLKIDIAHSEDVGVYKCEAVNKAGKAETKGELKINEADVKEVQTPPEFTVPLAEVKVEEGNPVDLTCTVRGSPTPEIQWVKNNQPVVADGKHIQISATIEGVQKLKIDIAHSEDVGVYKCEAVNKVGKAETKAELKVNKAEVKEVQVPPEFTVPLGEVKVEEGNPVDLTCTVKGSPPPEVKWLKDDKPVVADGKHIQISATIEGVQQLKIDIAHSEDVGVYKCVAENAAGQAKTQAPVKIDTKPEFIKPIDKALSADAGGDLVIECKVTGNPETWWTKDGVKINPDKKHIIESLPDGTQRLTVKGAGDEDAGRYKCHAKNSAGEADTEGTAEVKQLEKSSEDKAPEFIVPMVAKAIEIEQPVNLECQVVGSPKPSIQWMKDGSPVRADGKHVKIEETVEGLQKLKIDAAKSEDVGVYKCIATNYVGTANTEAKLDVKIAQVSALPTETAPEFIVPLKQANVIEGDAVALECTVKGDNVTISWKKDDSPVKADGAHIIIEEVKGVCKLKIDIAKSEDVGVYKCEAVNNVGTAKTEGKLVVKKAQQVEVPAETAPEFIVPLKQAAVTEGEPVALECTVKGDNVTISWKKDDTPVKADGTHIIIEEVKGVCKLKIDIAKSEDVGVYKCEAVNNAGTAKTEGKLVVKKAQQVEVPAETAPEFIVPLKQAAVTEGEPVALECTVKGDNVTISWKKDDTPVKADGAHIIVEEVKGVCKLKIDIAKSEDVGVYKCEAVNNAGTAKTEGKLVVKKAQQVEVPAETAPEFIVPLKQAAVTEGEPAALECTVKGENVTVTWKKDDAPVTADGKHIIIEQVEGLCKLKIDVAKSEDVGAYKCEATNKSGAAKTETYLEVKHATVADENVAVQTAPEFTVPLKETSVTAGETVDLVCAVKGDQVKVQWLKDSQPVVDDGKHIVIESKPDGEQRLHIDKATEADAGKYTCKAENPAGTAETAAPIALSHVAPEFIVPLAAAEFATGGQIKLECKVNGSPVPTCTWTFNGQPIVADQKNVFIESKKDGTQTLTILNAKSTNFGDYRCEAKNDAGQADTKAPVNAAVDDTGAAPDFIEQLKSVDGAFGSDIILTAKVSGSPFPDIRWLKGDKEVANDARHKIETKTDGTVSLTIKDAKPEDIGEYRVEASNPLGVSWSDALVNLKAAEIPPTFVRELKAQKVDEGDEITFECQVKGSPTPTVKWTKDGQEITGIRVIEAFEDGVHKLSIPSTKAEHQGNYKAEATNSAGSCSCRAPLSVIVLEVPEWTVPLKPTRCLEAEKLILECKVTGKVEKVVWQKNNVSLTESPKVKVESPGDGVHRVILQNTASYDSGTYTCVASNAAGDAKTTSEVTVAKKVTAPAFIDGGLKDQTVKIGETATFEVKINGGGETPTISWHKNGQAVPLARCKTTYDDGTGVARLVIADAKEEDQASYSIKVLNSAGEIDSSAQLTVKISAPSITRELQDQTVFKGSKLQFEIHARGPVSTVKWFKDGKELSAEADRRVHIEKPTETIFKLVIDDSDVQYSGTYKVELTNSAGSADASAKGTVKLPLPSFVRGLVDKVCEAGDEVKFTIETASAVTSAKWFINGKEVSESGRFKLEKVSDSKYVLTITKAEVDDTGSIKVVVANEGGEVESSAKLTVNKKDVQKPRITGKLTDQTVKVGEPVTFTVSCSGDPPTKVKWTRKGLSIDADARIKMLKIDDFTYTLTISDCQLEDMAQYTVELSNDAGSADSYGALTVKLPPAPKPAFLKGLTDQTVDKGNDCTFDIEVNTKPRSIKWYKNGVELRVSNRVKPEQLSDTKYRLEISAADAEDDAEYRVVVENESGSADSSARLKVKLPPEPSLIILKPLTDLKVTEGREATFICEVKGNPTSVKWLRNGSQVGEGKGISISTQNVPGTSNVVRYTLTVADCKKTDESTFSIELSDREMSVSSKGDLTIRIPEAVKEANSPPVFVIPMSVGSAVEGTNHSFDIKVRAKPAAKITWLKDGKELALSDRIISEDMSDHRWKLTIKDVTAEDEGKYTCVAENEAGEERSVGSLSVRAGRAKQRTGEGYPPRFNVQLRDRRIQLGQKMNIECFVDASPSATIEWTKDGHPIETSSRVRIEQGRDGRCAIVIDDFTVEDVGSYRCIATNELGKAETNGKITPAGQVEVEEAVKKGYAPKFQTEPDNQKRASGNAVIECIVFGEPPPIITWFKDGVPVRYDSRIRSEYNSETGVARLYIDNATSFDSAAYRVVANNEHGSSNAMCTLTIAGDKPLRKADGEEPFFTKGLVDSWFEKAKQIVIIVEYTGEPEPEIKWYKDGTLLRNIGRYTIEELSKGVCRLTINGCTFSDEGIYRCEARNKLGVAKTQATMYVEALRAVTKLNLSSGEAPKFVIPLEDVTRINGTTLSLDCKVTGDPEPTLKWSKDGTTLNFTSRVTCVKSTEETGRYVLTINDIRSSDEGTYRCVASNENGTATTKSFLTIDTGKATITSVRSVAPSTGPAFVVPLTDVRTNEGRLLTITCKVSGEPLPTIQVFKDGEKISDNDSRRLIDIQPDGTVTISVREASKEDEGMYRVMAGNTHGTAQQKCNVSVKPSFGLELNRERVHMNGDASSAGGRAPSCSHSLETSKVREGLTMTLTCRFIGTRPLRCTWFKDGERLYAFNRMSLIEHAEGDYELVVKEVQKSDAGCYRCVCENDFGSARSSCEVVIEEKSKSRLTVDEMLKAGKAPGFSTPLIVRRAKEGGNVIFECVAYGSPFPNIKWLKDGVEVTSAGRTVVEQLPDGKQRLTICDLTTDDEGLIRCVASNIHGTTSTKAELIVERDESRKKPKLDYESLPPRAKRPHFRQPLHNITVPVSGVAEFVANISAHPEATVKWYRNGQLLEKSSKVMMFVDEWGNHRLVLLDVQSDDQGEIWCMAENEMGTARSDASLNVLKSRQELLHGGKDSDDIFLEKPPMFVKLLRTKNTFVGVPVILDCQVVGTPTPSVTWYKNGQKLESNDRYKIQSVGETERQSITAVGTHVLIISNATVEDTGDYVAVAENKCGTARTSCKVNIEAPTWSREGEDEGSRYAADWMFKKINYAGIPPPPDRGPFISEASGHYLTLSWIPTKRPPPHYQQIVYVVEIRELPYPDWEVLDYNIPDPVCKVRNLELGKSYQFRVRAENIYGISDPSPASPPSKLMSKPGPVLDSKRAPIHLCDPWMEKAQNKSYGEQYACAPWFQPRENDHFYCGVNDSLEVTCHVSGFPDPKIIWMHKGKEIDFNSDITSRVKTTVLGGTVCILSVRGFQLPDAGQYSCVASNSYGEAQQSFWIDKADHPSFVDQLQNADSTIGKTITLKARVSGNPSPDVKWVKDWHPVAESTRIRFHREGNVVSMSISETIARDTGVYSCIATNAAGRASTSCTLTVLPEVEERPFEMTRRKVTVMSRTVRDVFDIKDELAFISWFLIDSLLLLDDVFCEQHVANIIRQILLAIQHCHSKRIINIDVRPENIGITPSGIVQILDFGTAFKMQPNAIDPPIGDVGSIEFASPELVSGEPVTPATDLWSIGVLTHVLLTGVSPFRAVSEDRTQLNIIRGHLEHSIDNMPDVSSPAKQFVDSLLRIEPTERPSVSTALSHSWLSSAGDHSSTQLRSRLSQFHYRHRKVTCYTRTLALPEMMSAKPSRRIGGSGAPILRKACCAESVCAKCYAEVKI